MWPDVIGRLANYDPGNEYADQLHVGHHGRSATTQAKIKERMPDAPLGSWKMVVQA